MWLAVALLPVTLYLAGVLREGGILRAGNREPHGQAVRRKRLRDVFLALGVGALVALPVELALRAVGSRLGVDPKAQVTGAWSSILSTLLLFAPLEEGAKLSALLPFRTRFFKGGWEGLRWGAGVAAGFACIEVAWFSREATLHGEPVALLVARATLATIARLFAGAIWGYALGRVSKSGWRTLLFAWWAATLLRGLYDHLIFGRGLAALLGSIPLFVGIVIVSYLAARELRPMRSALHGNNRRRRVFGASPPPSLRSIRDALRRAERPVMVHWIVLGAVVTVGVIVSCVAGAVVLGLRLGVDFAAVEEGAMSGAVPLALIGIGVLLAFPASGYLVARASGADSVLEAALSTGLAIVATLVMLGLAAPVAVVFALAFAPVAFALACAGAWVGIGGAQG